MFYAITQGMSMTCLIYIRSNLTDHEFLYVDLCLVFPLIITQCFTMAKPQLTNKLPPPSMITVKILINQFLHHALQVGFAILISATIQQYETPEAFVECTYNEENEDASYVCTRNTGIFLVTNFQYVIFCIYLNAMAQFRRRIYTNFLLSLCFAILLSLHILMINKPYFLDFIGFFEMVEMSQQAMNYVNIIVAIYAGSAIVLVFGINFRDIQWWARKVVEENGNKS